MRQNPPAPAANVPMTVIGVIRSAHTEPETTPIQAALNRADHAAIEIAEPYREGLAGLDGFGYAWLLTWLHRPGDRKDAGDRKEPGAREGRAPRGGLPPLRQVPFLLRRQQREMGIFATRGPRRVNPIGLSLIQLLEVTPETVRFARRSALRVVRRSGPRRGQHPRPAGPARAPLLSAPAGPGVA
jgi:tRNA (Thr-GGU) A37 N-methylase